MRKGICRRDGRCPAIGRRIGGFTAVIGIALAGQAAVMPLAQANPTAVTIVGVPQQIIPEVGEVGIGNFSIPTGTPSNAAQSSNTGQSGASASTSTPSDALNTMMNTSWGAEAAQNAAALGVNATALAATCVLESGCQNEGGSGTISGAFQMSASTYQEALNAALQQNPNLATNAVQGLAGQNDPETEAIAASEYLLQGAKALQADGVSNPTVLQVRSYYNFGPAGATAITGASPDSTMSSVLSYLSSSQLAANGITAGETVSQWQASVAAKLGNAANASVLL